MRDRVTLSYAERQEKPLFVFKWKAIHYFVAERNDCALSRQFKFNGYQWQTDIYTVFICNYHYRFVRPHNKYNYNLTYFSQWLPSCGSRKLYHGNHGWIIICYSRLVFMCQFSPRSVQPLPWLNNKHPSIHPNMCIYNILPSHYLYLCLLWKFASFKEKSIVFTSSTLGHANGQRVNKK